MSQKSDDAESITIFTKNRSSCPIFQQIHVTTPAVMRTIQNKSFAQTLMTMHTLQVHIN